MGRKFTVAVGALVALGLAAGGFYWMRARGAQALPLPDVVSPEPPWIMRVLSTAEWSATREVTSRVYDGQRRYEVRAKLARGSVAVGVPAADSRARKIALHVFENCGESQDAYFALYLANDAARTP